VEEGREEMGLEGREEVASPSIFSDMRKEEESRSQMGHVNDEKGKGE
jgi:hypothetical protein